MKRWLVLVFLAVASSAQAQVSSELIDDLNEAIITRNHTTFEDLNPATKSPPEWGIAIRNSDGQIIDLFGQVPYEVTEAGTVSIPGFNPPPQTHLELVPGGEWIAASSEIETDLDPLFAPLTALPSVVGDATEYLARELCELRGRPSEITLSLVVGASGNIFFATASTEAGSEVMWDFANDVCPRFMAE